MQPLNNLTTEISTTNGSSVNLNTNHLLDSLSLGKLKINYILIFYIHILIKHNVSILIRSTDN